MRRAPTLSLIACLAALFAAPPAAAAEDDSPTLKAMRDEIGRTLERLRMDDVEPSYFVTYTLNERKSYSCSSSFGALVESAPGGGRSVSIDVRVGDYELDNTNFVNRFYLTGRRRSVSLTNDDDYWTTRQRLWLASDTAYKSAVEDISAKEAWLKTNRVKDRPADLARIEPIEYTEPVLPLEVDPPAMEELTRRLSAVFRDAEKLQGSRASITAGASSSTAISSEGRATLTSGRYVRLTAQAWTQAEDGMPLGDLAVWYADTAAELPDEATLEAGVQRMKERLTERVTAPRAEEYIGPVLFEGEAACFLMLELLIDRLSAPHEPLAMPTAGTPFKNRLNRRVTPDFLTILDDPTKTEWEGTPLLGHFMVDDDGVRAQPLTLVEEGRLRAFYMSRIPTRAIQASNGHSRGGSGGPGNVFVRSSHTLSKEALRAELLAVAKDQELPYGIRVEVMARSDVPVSGARASGRYRSGSISLSPPVAAYRVYLDGREEPIRGGEWQGVTLRSLRDIYVTGDTPTVLNASRGGFVSVVCPDLLLEELEMKRPEEQEAKLPYLPHPSFAGR